MSIRLDDQLPIDKTLVEAIDKNIATEIGHKQNIPRTIIQTNENSKIPTDMATAIQNLIDLNPTYDYIYFDDRKSREFIKEHFSPRVLKSYDTIVPGAYKADLFRYCVLYEKGGVYVDTGMVALSSLDDIILPTDLFVSPEDNGLGGIYNAFMCAVPGHPIIKMAIDMCVENIEKKRYMTDRSRSTLRITGPLLLADAFEQVLKEKAVPNKDYGNGVRLLQFYCNEESKCASGELFSGDNVAFYSKYPTYHLDKKWYNTKPSYGKMWADRKVFGEK